MKLSLVYARWFLIAIPLSLSGCVNMVDQAEPEAPPKLLAAIERGYCYGNCPIFSLKIYFDGTAIFWGEQHTAEVGGKTFSLTDEQLSRIRSEFLRKGFLFLSNRCCECRDVTDAPSTLITYRGNGPFKQIKHYHGCSNWASRNLANLERSILELTGISAWIGEDG